MPIRASRKVEGTALTTYNWAKVPRKLIDQAIAKCRAQIPPTSLKWKLIELLDAWVKGKITIQQ